MYTAKVYNIMIGAPSDIQKEIQIAKDVIFRWDIINSQFHNCVLLPLHWQDNTHPSTGNPPQKSIDKQIVEKSDLLVCIFCSRLGSPTDTHISGSVEEIEEHVKAGKQVLTFFRKKGNTPQNQNDLEQYKRLLDYKDSIKGSVYWGEYEDVTDFERIFREKLELYLNNNWLNRVNSIDNMPEKLKLSDLDNRRLITWVNSKKKQFVRKGPSKGKCLFVLGDRNFFTVTEGEEYSEWENFFERMEQIGFVEKYTTNSKNEPFYKLKYPAFEYVKSMSEQNLDD